MTHDPQKIMDRMAELNKELAERNKEIQSLAEDVAERTKIHRMTKAEVILRLQSEDTKITLIKDIAKGNKAVAESKKNLMISEAIYKIALEKLKDIRSNIDTLRSFLTWIRMEYRNSND